MPSLSSLLVHYLITQQPVWCKIILSCCLLCWNRFDWNTKKAAITWFLWQLWHFNQRFIMKYSLVEISLHVCEWTPTTICCWRHSFRRKGPLRRKVKHESSSLVTSAFCNQSYLPREENLEVPTCSQQHSWGGRKSEAAKSRGDAG